MSGGPGLKLSLVDLVAGGGQVAKEDADAGVQQVWGGEDEYVIKVTPYFGVHRVAGAVCSDKVAYFNVRGTKGFVNAVGEANWGKGVALVPPIVRKDQVWLIVGIPGDVGAMPVVELCCIAYSLWAFSKNGPEGRGTILRVGAIRAVDLGYCVLCSVEVGLDRLRKNLRGRGDADGELVRREVFAEFGLELGTDSASGEPSQSVWRC